MTKLFISYAGSDLNKAVALRNWLKDAFGYTNQDIFIDEDPEGGMVAAQRWRQQLEQAGARCEAVIYLISRDWLASEACKYERHLVSKLNREFIPAITDDTPIDSLSGELGNRHVVTLRQSENAEENWSTLITLRGGAHEPVYFPKDGLIRIRRSLAQIRVSPERFPWPRDSAEVSGFRFPYRGLSALDISDAAVFFGRDADISYGLDVIRSLITERRSSILVVQGDSGAGKSSFLAAGLLPRLQREDQFWLPLRPIRAGRGGVIDGPNGLLSALEHALQLVGIAKSRSEIRRRVCQPDGFVQCLAELAQKAQAISGGAVRPRIVVGVDQAEELFVEEVREQSRQFLELVRVAIESDQIILIATVRTDSYGGLQNASELQGLLQTPFNLTAIPTGELSKIIEVPAKHYREIVRGNGGANTPLISPSVCGRLQLEMANERDALPLLAYVLERLMRDHAQSGEITLEHLKESGGLGDAINDACEGALDDAGIPRDEQQRTSLVRKMFVPGLARIDMESKMPHRRVGDRTDLEKISPAVLKSFIDRRLLVTRGENASTKPVEVAHEAILRRWNRLEAILIESQEKLLVLEGVKAAALEWNRATGEQKQDHLAHRGTRLQAAEGLLAEGSEWASQLKPARDYLLACRARERAELQLLEDRVQSLYAREASEAFAAGDPMQALRIAMMGWPSNEQQSQGVRIQPHLEAQIIRAVQFDAQLELVSLHNARIFDICFDPSGCRIATASEDATLRILDTRDRSASDPFVGHDNSVRAVAFDASGAFVASASDDGTIVIWDAMRGRAVRRSASLGCPLCAVVFLDDGTAVLAGDSRGAVHRWSWQGDGQPEIFSLIHNLHPWLDEVVTLQELKGARFLVAWRSGELAIVDSLGRREKTYVIEGRQIISFAVRQGAEDGHNAGIAVASLQEGDNRADAVRLSWPDMSHEIPLLGHGGATTRILLNASARRALSISSGFLSDNRACLWDLITGQRLAVYNARCGIPACAFAPDNLQVALGTDGGEVAIWNTKWATAPDLIGNRLMNAILECIPRRTFLLQAEDHKRLSEFSLAIAIGEDVSARLRDSYRSTPEAEDNDQPS